MWDWLGPLLGAVGAFLVTSVPLYLRIAADRRKAVAEKTKTSITADRQARRDTIEEWKAVCETLREDRDSDRKLIHDLRDDLGAVSNRLAVCEATRAAQEKRLDALEKGRAEGKT